SAFAIPSGDSTLRAIFIFATENGTIAAWNPKPTATEAVEVASTPGAIYKGLAVAYTTLGPRLFAANFHAGTIDVFNRHFKPITLSGSFSDPNLPSGYAPFNVAAIGGRLFVAFAKQDDQQTDDVPGPGLGFV